MSASTEQNPDRREPIGVVSELLGTVVTLEVTVGATVGAGHVVALIESMKLHHEVAAPAAGRVVGIAVAVGDTVRPGDLLFELAVGDSTPRRPANPMVRHQRRRPGRRRPGSNAPTWQR